MIPPLLSYDELYPLVDITHCVISSIEHTNGINLLMLNQNLKSNLVEGDSSSKYPLHYPSSTTLAQIFLLDKNGCSIQFVETNVHVDLLLSQADTNVGFESSSRLGWK